MSYARVVKPGNNVDLDAYDAGNTDGLSKEDGHERLDELGKELRELQDLLFFARQQSVLIVLQGMDTSGKDGTIRCISDYVNVQGCSVANFKVPTEKELAHDFLWRVHAETPGKGEIKIFNRSHYEDVLVVRVHDLAPKAVWEKRYQHINHFEKLLTDSDTVVLKFFLHISKKEQEERLREREEEAEKAWKLSVGDWKEREHWDDYQTAIEDALCECSTKEAPWYIVNANKKWFRNLAVLEAIVDALRPYRASWIENLEDLGIERKREIEKYRRGRKA